MWGASESCSLNAQFFSGSLVPYNLQSNRPLVRHVDQERALYR